MKQPKLTHKMLTELILSRIYLNRGQVGLDIVVVGAPSLIEQKLRVSSTQGTKQKVLKG